MRYFNFDCDGLYSPLADLLQDIRHLKLKHPFLHVNSHTGTHTLDTSKTYFQNITDWSLLVTHLESLPWLINDVLVHAEQHTPQSCRVSLDIRLDVLQRHTSINTPMNSELLNLDYMYHDGNDWKVNHCHAICVVFDITERQVEECLSAKRDSKEALAGTVRLSLHTLFPLRNELDVKVKERFDINEFQALYYRQHAIRIEHVFGPHPHVTTEQFLTGSLVLSQPVYTHTPESRVPFHQGRDSQPDYRFSDFKTNIKDLIICRQLNLSNPFLLSSKMQHQLQQLRDDIIRLKPLAEADLVANDSAAEETRTIDISLDDIACSLQSVQQHKLRVEQRQSTAKANAEQDNRDYLKSLFEGHENQQDLIEDFRVFLANVVVNLNSDNKHHVYTVQGLPFTFETMDKKKIKSLKRDVKKDLEANKDILQIILNRLPKRLMDHHSLNSIQTPHHDALLLALTEVQNLQQRIRPEEIRTIQQLSNMNDKLITTSLYLKEHNLIALNEDLETLILQHQSGNIHQNFMEHMEKFDAIYQIISALDADFVAERKRIQLKITNAVKAAVTCLIDCDVRRVLEQHPYLINNIDGLYTLNREALKHFIVNDYSVVPELAALATHLFHDISFFLAFEVTMQASLNEEQCERLQQAQQDLKLYLGYLRSMSDTFPYVFGAQPDYDLETNHEHSTVHLLKLVQLKVTTLQQLSTAVLEFDASTNSARQADAIIRAYAMASFVHGFVTLTDIAEYSEVNLKLNPPPKLTRASSNPDTHTVQPDQCHQVMSKEGDTPKIHQVRLARSNLPPRAVRTNSYGSFFDDTRHTLSSPYCITAIADSAFDTTQRCSVSNSGSVTYESSVANKGHPG